MPSKKVTCPICLEEVDELIDYDGEDMCAECAEEFSNKDALNDYYKSESIKHMSLDDGEF